MSQEHDEMSEQSNRLVGSWISGLFDSEAGGLGDDLMSSCIPQEFYLLVATVFKNVMAGYESKHLSEENLKSGIECKS